MGGNFGYPCTTPGIIKCITIATGFFASGIVWATIYQEDTFSKLAMDYPDFQSSCLKKEKNPCPDSGYLVSAASTTFAMFIISLIVLIIFLFVELQKNSMLNLIDFVGHIVGGFILIVMGILCVVYIVQGYMYKDCGNKPETWKKGCEDKRAKMFPILSLAGSAAIVFLDGALYIAAGLAVNKQKN